MAQAKQGRHESSTRSKIGGIRRSRKRLRLTIFLFSIALAVLFGVMFWQIHHGLRMEAIGRDRELAGRIGDTVILEVSRFLNVEQSRPSEHYSFYLLPKSGVKSPLSEFPSQILLPGLIGHFEIQSNGDFYSPILPRRSGESGFLTKDILDLERFDERQQVWDKLLNLCEINGLTDPEAILQFRAAKELQLLLLKGGEFALVRLQQVEEESWLQGFILEPNRLFSWISKRALEREVLESLLALKFVYQRSTILEILTDSTRADSSTSDGEPLLFHEMFREPLEGLSLAVSVRNLEFGGSAKVVIQLVIALVVVLIWGVVVIYHLSSGHLELAEERGDFVSSVTHELKSPLTTIRMYSEMLRQNWIKDEQKKRSYYDHIFYESERLSRLIDNVLDMARLNRDEFQVQFEERALSDLLEQVKAAILPRIEFAGFELQIEGMPSSSDAQELRVLVDSDAFTRIFVNLTDNALKFSKGAEHKVIQLQVALSENDENGEGVLAFSFRDFGPGIPSEQRERIFDLFYRGESELTRATPGTGIGLALVKELAEKMGASVELVIPDVGAEFRIYFTGRAPSR